MSKARSSHPDSTESGQVSFRSASNSSNTTDHDRLRFGRGQSWSSRILESGRGTFSIHDHDQMTRPGRGRGQFSAERGGGPKSGI